MLLSAACSPVSMIFGGGGVCPDLSGLYADAGVETGDPVLGYTSLGLQLPNVIRSAGTDFESDDRDCFRSAPTFEARYVEIQMTDPETFRFRTFGWGRMEEHVLRPARCQFVGCADGTLRSARNLGGNRRMTGYRWTKAPDGSLVLDATDERIGDNWQRVSRRESSVRWQRVSEAEITAAARDGDVVAAVAAAAAFGIWEPLDELARAGDAEASAAYERLRCESGVAQDCP